MVATFFLPFCLYLRVLLSQCVQNVIQTVTSVCYRMTTIIFATQKCMV